VHVHMRLQMLMQVRMHLVIHSASAAVLRSVLDLLLRAPSFVREGRTTDCRFLQSQNSCRPCLPEAIMVGPLDGNGGWLDDGQRA
jgi:hypothetical protein